jgi:sugar phosphate permease
VTTNWFPESERAFSTTVGTSANIFGVLFGFLFPALFVSEGTQDEIRNMMVAASLVCTISALGVVFRFGERAPPSDQP